VDSKVKIGTVLCPKS